MPSEDSNNTPSLIRSPVNNIGLNMVAGGVAGLVTDFFFFPLDTVKTRIQASISGQDFSKLNKNKGYFTGLSASMVISAPACASYWGGYELIKKTLTENASSEVKLNFK
jgi:solute carrier family 25 (mitochondrial S-adenosylmethionine transporter), member 26